MEGYNAGRLHFVLQAGYEANSVGNGFRRNEILPDSDPTILSHTIVGESVPDNGDPTSRSNMAKAVACVVDYKEQGLRS